MSDPATTPATDDLQTAPEAATRPSPDTITLPVDEFEALKREVLEWKERCQRNQAEFDNVRKRLRKEADESGTRAVARSVKPLLTELDNLGRAIDAARPEAFSEFAMGVTMIRENLRAALAGQGLEQIVCEGVFDPAVHEVLAEQEDGSVPKGTIIQVHRTGWRLKDQLVRAAQVVVARPPVAPSA
jgi:molecular chaperone GrpE